jgi:hypothetical protein
MCFDDKEENEEETNTATDYIGDVAQLRSMA